jgi:alpha-glucosidase
MNRYAWWQRGTVYQVYPRSFMDSNGDGIGDLEGIRSRLDYLEWLGVDAVWLSPIYPSPMADFGYDVADYTSVHPIFGSMRDFDNLLADAHRRGLRLILDLVPNHTSEQHPWFVESRASRDSAKRHWYLWREPAPDGSPPNNWLSVFGGSGWKWDEASGQFYYHAFLEQQPDLNWRNPAVRRAMYEVMAFWLGKGIDGFRVDVLWHLIKDAMFRDNPENPDYRPGDSPYNALLPVYSTDQPEVHEIVTEMRALLDTYGERVLIGEIYLPIGRLVSYYGAGGGGAHLPFNFQLITLPWNAKLISAAISEYEAALPLNGWPNWVLGNHDQHRIASRVGLPQARVAAVLLLTLRGTPTLYYGDEIGMRDGVILPEQVQDPQEKNVPGLGLGRDPERTPMQWGPGRNAGFSSGTPWLPLAIDAAHANVETQKDDPRSMLTLYRRLLALRRAEPALSVGSFLPVPAPEEWIAYVRESGGRRLLVALNLGHRPGLLPLDHLGCAGQVVLATEPSREGERVERRLVLTGDDGLIVELDAEGTGGGGGSSS